MSHHLSLELNQPRYRWLPTPDVSESQNVPALRSEALELLHAAADGDGVVTLPESIGGCGLSAGTREFMGGTERSAAKWRAVLADVIDRGLLERVGEAVYRVSKTGYQTVDEADAAMATAIAANIHGSADQQSLHVEASLLVRLTGIDFLTSADVCVCSQVVAEEGKDVYALFSPRTVGSALLIHPDPNAIRRPVPVRPNCDW